MAMDKLWLEIRELDDELMISGPSWVTEQARVPSPAAAEDLI